MASIAKWLAKPATKPSAAPVGVGSKANTALPAAAPTIAWGVKVMGENDTINGKICRSKKCHLEVQTNRRRRKRPPRQLLWAWRELLARVSRQLRRMRRKRSQ